MTLTLYGVKREKEKRDGAKRIIRAWRQLVLPYGTSVVIMQHPAHWDSAILHLRTAPKEPRERAADWLYAGAGLAIDLLVHYGAFQPLKASQGQGAKV
ncbi:uncharacterized protein N7482_009710 [Penicillium canariense]|uniref:Uncharacterized protein n=1 Tax=Penicillium canariense TaxID=189055 RepID=A0A9W9LGB5_9EURO|nr:uncharacterized protein N7482_009710 [Penicillium canariense]KAJ5153232.1 hypothetical protein N7482_009710 [Penicillium canariense]